MATLRMLTFTQKQLVRKLARIIVLTVQSSVVVVVGIGIFFVWIYATALAADGTRRSRHSRRSSYSSRLMPNRYAVRLAHHMRAQMQGRQAG